MSRDLRARMVQNWFRLVRPMTLGVRVAAFDPAGQVCLVRHTYLPGWHLPGGGVERGETANRAALKELREEAGILADAADLELHGVFANFVHFPGDHVLVYRCDRFTTVPTRNGHEIAETGFFAPERLPDGTTRGTRQRLAELAGAPLIDSWVP